MTTLLAERSHARTEERALALTVDPGTVKRQQVWEAWGDVTERTGRCVPWWPLWWS